MVHISVNSIIPQKHKAAIYYADIFKWALFPVHSIQNGKCTCLKSNCESPGKHPRTQNGVKDATMDRTQINKWWTRFPDSNIGIATGKASGFIVIDVDQGGEESLHQLVEQYEPLPDTVESITGSRGRHIFYKCPDDFNGTINNKVGFIPNIDIRADGGYIVCPPSIHESGNCYEWELSSRPNEVEISLIPNWLLTLLQQPEGGKVEKKPTSHWTSIMNGVSEGGRNHAAASLAGHLFRSYIDPELAAEFIKLWNNERNDPPLDEVELNRTIESIAGKELARRNGGEIRIDY